MFPIIKKERLHYKKRIFYGLENVATRNFKLLAEECGIEKNLTSYVSRHSFCNSGNVKEVPLNAISTMLGHRSLKTTQVYLKSLPSTMFDD
ncbi:MAG: tyrosine-type recombinase/integrase [Bacteroidetes bacterium]|nr:tyrosine-type recombinase/integrase [Bacteroidota bacterium]